LFAAICSTKTSFFFSFFLFSLFFFFFLVFHFHLFLFSFSLFEKIRVQLVLRTNTIRDVDAFFFFWRRNENWSWCRSENAWKNESKHHKHSHRCFVSLIVQRRRFIKLIFVDKRLNWHLRFIAQCSRESRWSWRDEKIVFELRKYFFLFESFFFSLLHEFSQRKNFSNSRLATNIFRDEVNHDERLNENLIRRNIKNRINLRLINHEKAIDKFTINVRRDKQHLKSHCSETRQRSEKMKSRDESEMRSDIDRCSHR
jgi:hypothetical protein